MSPCLRVSETRPLRSRPPAAGLCPSDSSSCCRANVGPDRTRLDWTGGGKKLNRYGDMCVCVCDSKLTELRVVKKNKIKWLKAADEQPLADSTVQQAEAVASLLCCQELRYSDHSHVRVVDMKPRFAPWFVLRPEVCGQVAWLRPKGVKIHQTAAISLSTNNFTCCLFSLQQ